jgi:hypothetical protein
VNVPDDDVVFAVGLNGHIRCDSHARRWTVLFAELIVALQYSAVVAVAILIAAALAGGLLVPYLVKEIRRGKAELGPRLPTGPSEPHPGRPGNPAPGHPEAQADPYVPEARR